MSDLVEDMGKVLSLYHDGEDNLAHIYAMKCIRIHHATIQQNAEDAKRLKALERAMVNFMPPLKRQAVWDRAAEILREGEEL